jgi:hypothetical protein
LPNRTKSAVEAEADGTLRTAAPELAPARQGSIDTDVVRSSALKPSETGPTATVQADPVVIEPLERGVILASEPRPAPRKAVAPPPRPVRERSAPRVAAPPAPKAQPTPRARRTGGGKGGECDPPYYFDEQHIKRVKYKCL